MQTSVVTKSLGERFGNRIDARFLLKAQEFLPIIEEVAACYTVEQLKDFAARLPLDSDAGKLVFLSQQYPSASSRFDGRIMGARMKRVANPLVVAAYIVFACNNLASKMLMQVEELSQQKSKILGLLRSVIVEVSTGKTPLLEQSVKQDACIALAKLRAEEG